jgi:hypothetical protein
LLIVLGSNCRANQIKPKESNQKPSAPISTVPAQQPDSEALNPKQQKDIHAYVKIINPPEKDFYDKAPVWINLSLVFVALGTGMVIAIQSWETRKAAEAALASVKLQEVQYKQWVVIDCWENLTQHLQPTQGEADLRIKFEVCNATKFPLTLMVLKIAKDRESSSLASMNCIIAPDDSYVANHVFSVSPAELDLYRRGELLVPITVETEIKDILERYCAPQKVTHTVTLGPTKCNVVSHPVHFQLRIKQIK